LLVYNALTAPFFVILQNRGGVILPYFCILQKILITYISRTQAAKIANAVAIPRFIISQIYNALILLCFVILQIKD